MFEKIKKIFLKFLKITCNIIKLLVVFSKETSYKNIFIQNTSIINTSIKNIACTLGNRQRLAK